MHACSLTSALRFRPWLQPLEVLRVGMKREFMVVEDEDEYDQVILSLAAQEVRHGHWARSMASAWA